MRGIDWTRTAEEIAEFFAGFGELKPENVHVELYNGKKSGTVLVIFENEKFAAEAKAAK